MSRRKRRQQQQAPANIPPATMPTGNIPGNPTTVQSTGAGGIQPQSPPVSGGNNPPTQTQQPTVPVPAHMQALSNFVVRTFGSAQGLHRLLWNILAMLLVVRIATLLLLSHGWSTTAIAFDFLALLPIFFFATDPKIIAAALAISGITSAKDGGKDFEDEVVKYLGGWFGFLISAYAWMFVVPDVFGKVAGPMSVESTWSLVVLAAFAGILCFAAKIEAGTTIKLFAALVIAAIAYEVLPRLSGIYPESESWARGIEGFRPMVTIAVFIIVSVLFFGGSPVKWVSEKLSWGTVRSLAMFALVILAVSIVIWPKETTKKTVNAVLDVGKGYQEAVGDTANQGSQSTGQGQQQATDAGEKIVVKQTGGTLAAVQGKPSVDESRCDSLVAEIPFEPDTTTFHIKPTLLAKAAKGDYLLKVTGAREQWFLVDGVAKYFRIMDADGHMLDETTQRIWTTESVTDGPLALFPEKPYGGLLLRVDGNQQYAGSNYRFTVKKSDSPIEMDINVFQHPSNYKSTNSNMKAHVFKCSSSQAS